MRIEYKKVCTKQEAEDVRRLWIDSNIGLNKVLIEGRSGWFRSIPKITAGWNDVYSVKFSFLPDPPIQQVA